MTTEIDLAHHVHQLKLLLKTANDPKLLWEEMQILGKKAFHLQSKMEEELDELEQATQEITAVQMIYETRETMWDIMNQLAKRELELKEKPHPSTKPQESCGCSGSHDECCHHTHDCCCHQKKKCCDKGKKNEK